MPGVVLLALDLAPVKLAEESSGATRALSDSADDGVLDIVGGEGRESGRGRQSVCRSEVVYVEDGTRRMARHLGRELPRRVAAPFPGLRPNDAAELVDALGP